MKTRDQLTASESHHEKQDEADVLTVQIKINHKKHTCPMCCIEFCNVSPSHVEGEFTDGHVYDNNGSIIPVKPVTCDCCGLKVVESAQD